MAFFSEKEAHICCFVGTVVMSFIVLPPQDEWGHAVLLALINHLSINEAI